MTHTEKLAFLDAAWRSNRPGEGLLRTVGDSAGQLTSQGIGAVKGITDQNLQGPVGNVVGDTLGLMKNNPLTTLGMAASIPLALKAYRALFGQRGGGYPQYKYAGYRAPVMEVEQARQREYTDDDAKQDLTSLLSGAGGALGGGALGGLLGSLADVGLFSNRNLAIPGALGGAAVGGPLGALIGHTVSGHNLAKKRREEWEARMRQRDDHTGQDKEAAFARGAASLLGRGARYMSQPKGLGTMASKFKPTFSTAANQAGQFAQRAGAGAASFARQVPRNAYMAAGAATGGAAGGAYGLDKYRGYRYRQSVPQWLHPLMAMLAPNDIARYYR